MDKSMDKISEWKTVEIKVYEFTFKRYKIHCVLEDNQVSIVKGFFEKINNGDDWEQSKLSSMIELIKIRYPEVPIGSYDILEKNGMFATVKHIFTELENNTIIKNIIREGKIDDIIE